MSAHPTIRVENLAKQYQLGMRQRNVSFREMVMDTLTSPWQRFRRLSGKVGEQETFWALDDVSFDVHEGEVVGVIGSNGAGKSTLLKILSEITEPTRGSITLDGRVASLLEVGTGFHPELTGRENIFLNGAILGMSRREIRDKFEAIVEFAEVSHFLDTPVKRYSSGMYVRLAFSVAAHLDPEILVVDEVLAVGDHAFQRKCLGKMHRVARSGRTVLFVSHNMATIQNLCTRCLLLSNGRLVDDCDPEQAVAQYCSTVTASSQCPVAKRDDRSGSGRARIVHIACLDADGLPVTAVPMNEDWTLEIDVEFQERIRRPHLGLIVGTSTGQRIARFLTSESHGDLPSLQGRVRFRCRASSLNLVPGQYQITCGVSDDRRENLDRVEAALLIEVIPADVSGTGRVTDSKMAICHFPARWEIEAMDRQGMLSPG